MAGGTDVTSTLASNRLRLCVYTSASLVLLMGEKLVQGWREVSWFKPEVNQYVFLKILNFPPKIVEVKQLY